jgi:transcriptional regulator with XRE-family HTH domain
MNKILNSSVLKTAMDNAGFSQAQLAKELNVSIETLSQWLKGKRFPSPEKLLSMGLLLELSFDEIQKPISSPAEPVVAFHNKSSTKTTTASITHAKNIGRMLTALVPYVPYDDFRQPATLKQPLNEYSYLQKLVAKIRAEIGVSPTEVLNFHHLIKKFNELQAVLIPVLWGQRQDNALHIYLPDSMTTWIYLNLDSEIHHFKFWMAHELGHVYAPTLTEAEDFADAFAAALLFPESLAKLAYETITQLKEINARINMITHLTEVQVISPLCGYEQLNKYAHHHNLPQVDLGSAIYETHFHKAHSCLSDIRFEGKKPSAASYLKACQQIFDTPFFEMLQKYLVETKKSAGFIQNVLDIPLLDAQAIYMELS